MTANSNALEHDDQETNLHDTLKYSLLGPSLTKSGQDSVDQRKVSDIIYDASKGSKFFAHEENRDKLLTVKIERILEKKARLEKLNLTRDQKKADEYVAELELSRDLSQTVVHVDCDAFYAAVEELDRPELKQVPFAVGKGVLTTCNYHARKFGCRSGMAGFVARKLCPELIQLPLNFEKYTAKAREVREIIARYDPRFESASIDEAYLNITTYCESNNIGPDEAVEQLRQEVHEKTKITISAGIAANTKLAKICSNMNKPNGQYRLQNDRGAIMAFMDTLPTRKVNGVGRVFERELDAVGVKTCGDIYQYRQYLSKLFGEKAFNFLMQCYLGLGRTNTQPAEEYERKSIGTESTFGDLSSHKALRDRLEKTAQDLEKDMVKAQFKGRTLVLKVKLHTYEVLTRQVIPPKAVYLAPDLYKYSLPMLSKLEQEFKGLTLRLMGLRCTHLVTMKKPDPLAFFGHPKMRSGSASSGPTSGSNESKVEPLEADGNSPSGVWPSEDFEEAAKDEYQEELEELEILSQLEELGNQQPSEGPLDSETKPESEDRWWDCPICLRPQMGDCNEHIDMCLSRPTILGLVKETAREASSASASAEKGKGLSKRGRQDSGKARTGSKDDPKQTRLSFN
ncbi:hypothetical protein V498_03165 [Pseudogymnoascus sp. VKM F-4517 (FW-2822)]|nr:hypothetical protein V498_03165 [Pseudogymnoascus sp. VKM F-4517 (FW-2822)]